LKPTASVCFSDGEFSFRSITVQLLLCFRNVRVKRMFDSLCDILS
jgi:hypothetical protein